MNIPRTDRFSDINQLRTYIYKTLCDTDQLVLGQFPMTERILMRAGRACGVLFSLYGPRAVMLTAVWETDQNQLFFYNSCGERFLKRQITSAPTLDCSEILE